VVIISGGARGVTAATAAALARRRALTLILLGRSPAPFPEPGWLKGLESEADLKKAIIANEYAATRPTPQTVQESYHRYRSNREIQHSLAALKAAGADARYVSLDIREADKVRAVLNDVRLVHGPIKALVHGAGVLRDRMISDKSAEEFHQVFSTKVEGLENLLAATRTDPLRYIVLFSSVAARFGNIGQVDYAVANEVLNKMAVAEAAQRKDCLVRSINWGPWDGGMVTAAHKKAFRAKDIALIPIERGAEAFVSELTAGQARPVEVVIGSELPSASLSISPPIAAEPANSPGDNAAAGLSTVYISELNLERYPILDHHRLDGKPVVPFALMAEWFGHGALHNNPGFQLAGLDAMRLLKGIVLDDHQRPIRVLTSAAESTGDGITVNLELRNGMAAGAEVIHSKATALLTDRLPSAPDFDIPADLRNAAYGRDVAHIYADILFHGHALQGIRRVRGCTPKGMLADLSTAPTPGAWIQKPPRNRWIADPLVMDGAFQMASLWCYEETGRVSLPSFSASYRQYCRRFPDHPVQAVLVVRDVSRHKLVGDFTFIDRDGTVLATMRGYEAVMEDRLIRAFKPERYAAGR
jgi:NAD(P)-dependent dehydrogenase (short-subunit alcohol dehydrogenase family)